MAKTCDRSCRGCYHFYGEYRASRCCNYLLDTGIRRPCAPGTGCSVKEPFEHWTGANPEKVLKKIRKHMEMEGIV